ncbi:hypothetical protein V2G26_018280 [Clonostachys chloroleuca]
MLAEESLGREVFLSDSFCIRDIQGNINYNYLLHSAAPAEAAEVVHVIPYPRNEDLVRHQDLIDKLDKLLPQTSDFFSTALWGLGGSGKTRLP